MARLSSTFQVYLFISFVKGISSGSVTKNEGGSVDLFCPDNTAMNYIIWNKNSVQFASWNTISGIIISDSTLRTRGSMVAQTGKFTINNLVVADAGVYTCQVLDPISTDTQTTTLTIDVPPSDLSISGISMPRVAGHPTPIECIVGRVLRTEFDIYYKIGDDGTQTAITSIAETDNLDGTKRVVGTTSITFQKIDDSKRFHCIVTKKNLQTVIFNDTSVTLVIHYQPSCTISAGSAAQGSTTLFTCSCDGRPTVSSYTWYHNGTSITVSGRYSNPQPGKLQVTSVELTDSGSYTCKGANTAGEGGMSNSVDVSVLYKPIVSLTTVTNPVQENTQNVVLSCYSHENPTKTNVMWFFGETQLSVINSRYSGGTLAQPSLTIKQVNRNDGGRYLCRIVNPQGHGDSGYLDLNVTYCPSIASPGIINHRQNVTVQTEEIHLSCQIETQGNPPVKRYVWKKDGDLYRNTTSDVLRVTPTTVLDSGTYTCELQNDISPCNSATSAGTAVTIHAPPHVEPPSTDESYSPLHNMSDFRMMCVVSGIPAVTIEWKKGNDVLTSDDFTEFSVAQTGTFSYGQTTAQQSQVTWTAGGKYFTCQNITHFSGNYSCTGKNNGAGPDAVRQFSVNVKYPPMVSGVTTVAGQIRGTSTLVCNVCANPAPTTYKWYFRDVSSQVGDQQNLILTNINQTNFGEFICEVSNTVGTVQILYNLKPEGPPEPPENFMISEKTSQSVTLRWNAGYDGGYPQSFVIQYKKEGDDDSLYTTLDSIPQDSKSEISALVSGLSPATSYVFSIHSINTRSTTSNTSQMKDLMQSTRAKPVVIITSVTYDSNEVTIVWELQEGKPTKYTIQYRVSGEQDFQDLETDIPATQTNITVPITLTQSSYDFRIVASEGTLSSVQTQLEPQTFQQKIDPDQPNGGLIGGIVGAFIGILVVAAVIAFVMIKLRRKKDTKGDQLELGAGTSDLVVANDYMGSNGGVTNPALEGGDVEDINPYAESPHPSAANGRPPIAAKPAIATKPAKAAGAAGVEGLYAQPDKKKKQEKREQDPGALYAKPEKKKKKKGNEKDEELTTLYAQPDKAKKKKKKAEAKPAYDEDENPYQNVENKNDPGENPYANVDSGGQVGEEKVEDPKDSAKNIGPDGTVYADLTFTKKPKGKNQKDEIIRTEEATEYATIDFKRKAPPT